MNHRVLFVAEAGTLAHVARLVSLARSLSPDRYDIFFASAPFYDQVIGKFPGTRVLLNSRSPDEFMAAMSRGDAIFPEVLLTRYVAEDRSLMREIQPDIVVGDLRPSLSVSARCEGIPYTLITNANWCPAVRRRRIPFPVLAATHRIGLRGRWGRGLFSIIERLYQSAVPGILQKQCAGINAVRGRHGMAPYEDYFVGFTDSDCTLYADLEGLFPHDLLPPGHDFIGPVAWEPEMADPPWLRDIPNDKPLVYVNLGSSGDLRLLHQICAGLTGLGVTTVVGGGVGPPAPGVFWAPLLPGSRILARSAVAITNGGSPTSYQALAAGVPVLGIPSNMDQLLFMQFLEAAGLGVGIRADTVTRSDIRRAVVQLFSGSQGRVVRERLGQRIQPGGAQQRFQEHMSQILDARDGGVSVVGCR